MAISRKHYNAVAAKLQSIREVYDLHRGDINCSKAEAIMDRVEFALIEVFAQDNPNFDADRFLDACLPESQKVHIGF